jgi:uncharacterized protein (TIGR04255 family)
MTSLHKNSPASKVLKGHDFSRAAIDPQNDWALAPEGYSVDILCQHRPLLHCLFPVQSRLKLLGLRQQEIPEGAGALRPLNAAAHWVAFRPGFLSFLGSRERMQLEDQASGQCRIPPESPATHRNIAESREKSCHKPICHYKILDISISSRFNDSCVKKLLELQPVPEKGIGALCGYQDLGEEVFPWVSLRVFSFVCSILIDQGRSLMPNMPNAPLVYTIGVIRFPRIPEIGRFASAFLSAIRGEYPQFDEIALNFVRANFTVGPEGKAQTEIRDSRESKTFQFASPNKTWAFILSEDLFGLHTSNYRDHDDFIRRFREGLQGLLGVPGLGMEWIEAIGFRYVDLVKPLAGEPLEVYLDKWVLPPTPEVDVKMELVQGMYVALYRTEHGDLRFQSLRNPPMTLPLDLNTPLIQKNGWAADTPEGDFALIDIDHGCHFDPLEKVDVDRICSKFLELRLASRKLFDRAGTEHAMSVWRKEKPSHD